jgi:hypothetical protein
VSPYFIGLGLSVLASVATLLVKSSITRYPGVGDTWLAYFVSVTTGLAGGIAFYSTKALLAAALFSLIYLPFRKSPWFACRVSVLLTVFVLFVMSLGEVVIS